MTTAVKPEPEGLDYLKFKIKQLADIDLSAYKDRQMLRRLTMYLDRVKVADFYALGRRIAADEEALEKLKAFLTINVSHFFRNPDRFRRLAEGAMQEMAARHGTLKIWSAGCSIGAEPYSLAILADEVGPGADHTIYATDIDADALAAAAAGAYGKDALKEVSDERLERYFNPLDGDRWRVAPRIRDLVRFDRHNLIEDDYPAGFHLILCRNVVIYFKDAIKYRIMRRLGRALVPGGYLLIGETESLFDAPRLGLEPIGGFLYRRAE